MDNETNETQPTPEPSATPAPESEAAGESAGAAPEPAPEPAPLAAEAGSLSGALTLGTAPAEAAEPAPRIPTTIRGRVDKDGTAIGTGRRKTAVARVRLKKGTGIIKVNGREFAEYFPVERHRLVIEAPLRATNLLGQVDVKIKAEGGGVNGQAGAIVLGIARAVQAIAPEQHGALSDGGYLTRDDRMVERKKYGHRKARRSFQFSKR
jgi:small subunit ribosomal protein S9